MKNEAEQSHDNNTRVIEKKKKNNRLNSWLDFYNIWSPEYRFYWYVVAILLSSIQGFMTYCLEFPVGLQSIMIQVMRMDNKQYNLLFSAYTWLDIVMSTVGSILVNKYFGIRLGLIFSVLIFTTGQLFICIGAFSNEFLLILLGRVVLGIGKGTASSSGYSYQIRWFAGKEITFILSIGRCFTRIMATLALFTPTLIYKSLSFIGYSQYQHGATQAFATVLCFCCLFLSIAIALLDRQGTKRLQTGKDNLEHKEFNLVRDIKSYPLSFWFVTIICGLYYGVSYQSTANAPLFFVSKYNLAVTNANLANSFSYSFIIFTTPVIALLIDWLGYNFVWAFAGLLLAIVSNGIYIISDSTAYIPYCSAIVNSFAITLFSTAIWVVIGFLVKPHQTTTAFGIQMSVLALSVSLTGVISGLILDTAGYIILYLYYVWILIIVGLLIVFVSVLELVDGTKLINVSGKTRTHK